MVVVDGTVGSGGHALEILKAIGSTGRLVALDRDPEAIERCRSLFQSYPQVSLHQANFRNAEKILDLLNIPSADAVILDVGFSSDQLEDENRGFSFDREGPLDMRMDPGDPVRARDLVNDLSQEDLEKIFREYGEERWSKRFARAIEYARTEHPIETTGDLVRVIQSALPRSLIGTKSKRMPMLRRHPATRIFQALRIAVNDELNALSEGLARIWPRVKVGGRVAVITFHSLEDRIVKNQFRAWAQTGEATLIFRKPLTAQPEEIESNTRARSAKLRAAEKTHEGHR